MTDPHDEARENIHKPDADDARPDVADSLLAEMVERWPATGWDLTRGQRSAIVDRDGLTEVAEWLRRRGFEMCVDVCGVDYLDHWDRKMGTWSGEPTRFEVVVNLVNMHEPSRLRLRVPIDEDDPRCPTLAFVWPSADPHEREVYDLFGILFDGHPDLTRILMPDDWAGHPLRKDYAPARIPVTFKEGRETAGSGRPAAQPVVFKDVVPGGGAEEDGTP